MAALALDLDGVLGDTRPLWEAWLEDVARRAHVDPARLDEELPNWRALLEELVRLNRRQESREELTVIAHELRNLNESLQALAYAALGQQGPQVRRRRAG